MKRLTLTSWVVGITDVEVGETQTIGPYRRARAEQIAAAMERYFDGYGDSAPLVSAYPLQRVTIPELKRAWSDYKGSAV